MMTAYEFERWVRDSERGQRCIYHVGSVVEDRVGRQRRARRLAVLADVVMEFSELEYAIMTPCGHIQRMQQGSRDVRLVRMRAPKGKWAYVAERI